MKKFAIVLLLLSACSKPVEREPLPETALDLSKDDAVYVQVTGDFVASLQFEAAKDGAYVAMACVDAGSATVATSVTAPGVWQCATADYSRFRVRATALTSGKPHVKIRSRESLVEEMRGVQ